MVTEAQGSPLPEVDSSSSSLALLQTRLRRLEFLLSGHSHNHHHNHSHCDVDSGPTGEPTGKLSSKNTAVPSSTASVNARLSSLEQDLDRLRRLPGPTGDLIRDIESLHGKVPDVIGMGPTASRNDLATKASIVLSHATLYPETASRLSSLQTLPVPPAEQSAKLSTLRREIQVRQHVQESLELEIQDLQQRSAQCLEWWVKVGVAGMGDVCDDWQDRIADIEAYVGRLERRKQEHKGYL